MGIAKYLFFTKSFGEGINVEKILSENLQDSPPSGLNEMMIKKENAREIRNVLKNLPSCNIRNYGDKIRYVFMKDLTDEEKAFACLYVEERSLNGYGFTKNTKFY